MSKCTIIQEGTSIILSYNFLYDEESVNKGFEKGEIIKNDLHYENLLNYVDRLYEKNKIFYYKDVRGKKLYIYNKKDKKFYWVAIEDIYILFFDNNMAFLNLKLEYEGSSLEELYSINKHLTTFYTKADDQIYVAVGDDNFNQLNMDIERFEKECNDLIQDKNNLENLLKEVQKNKQELFESNGKSKKNEKLNFKIIKNANLVILNDDIGRGIDEIYIKFEPDISKNPIPFSDEELLQEYKDRVGPTIKEKKEIEQQNREEDFSEINQNYLYFENQQALTKKIKKEQNRLRYINYNTFISSLIMKYVKPNNGVFFYDNFNFIATNYINSYITLSCHSSLIDEAVENNFLYFEALISSKIKRGKKIVQADYFKIFQSQADIFTIGNSHNIVHILDDSLNKAIKNRKKSDHFYTYQLSQLQRNSILKIITASILNINKIAENELFRDKIINIYKTYFMINNSIDNFKKFLTNINFSTISNSASMDSSYKFFRECNDVEKLVSQWGTISFKLKDSRTTIEFIINESKVLFVLMTISVLIYSYWDTIRAFLYS